MSASEPADSGPDDARFMTISTTAHLPAHLAAVRDTAIMFVALPSVPCGLRLSGTGRVPLVTACTLAPTGLLLLGIAAAVAWQRCRPWLCVAAAQFRGVRNSVVAQSGLRVAERRQRSLPVE